MVALDGAELANKCVYGASLYISQVRSGEKPVKSSAPVVVENHFRSTLDDVGPHYAADVHDVMFDNRIHFTFIR
ncbi:hypothetical protein SAMN04487926_11854 [Paraburkholderia steynii]|uniref:Uncharacterized protein n=1 Tax=Paraburkholderia steynii TaxID=1245441 RepID=A0A7Z7BB00_9BURK|nr:hypothetical protein SAMN04487926_11854 [Paraburkholderia steynii]